MLINGIKLADRVSIPTQRHITDAGQMIVPCTFARTGKQLYTAKQMGLVDEDPNKIIEVNRSEKDVFDEDSMNSFRSSPVTIGHPKDETGKDIKVTVDNAAELQKGMLEGKAYRDEDTLAGVLVLTNKEAIDVVEEGTVELSAGYTCDIEVMEDGTYHQRNIRANHIAIVPRGRAGSSCRISDDADEVIQAMEDTDKQATSALVGDQEDSTNAVVILSRSLADATETVQRLETEAKRSNQQLTDAVEAEKVASTKVEAQSKLIVDLEVKLEDTIKINQEAVVERCDVINQAKFIADLDGFGDKSIIDIKKAVIDSQMPELNLEGKSDDYISARFDILVELADQETPMSKLLREVRTNDDKPVKQTNKVDDARKRSIERCKTK